MSARLSWKYLYTVRHKVEVLVPLATGAAWRPATMVRRTNSGFPVVRVHGIMPHDLVVSRKSDIRMFAGAR